MQEEATAGSAKPRRKACSVNAQADGLGLGGTPTSEPEIRKGYSGSLLAYVIRAYYA